MTTATLAEAVAAELRHALIHGRYVAGERLAEITLAREIGVSQNTVRDALRMLEQDGWVIRHSRRGVYVRSFSLDDALEVYALLAAVESIALEWVLETATKTRLADLRRYLVQARRFAQTDEPVTAIEALFTFHEALSASADKPLTLGILKQLMNCARLLEAIRQARMPRSPQELEAQISAHDHLLRLIEHGKREAARAALRSIIDSYRDLVMPALEMGQ